MGPALKMSGSVSPLLCLLLLAIRTGCPVRCGLCSYPQPGAAGGEAAAFCGHLWLQQNRQLNPSSSVFVSGDF